MNSNERCETCLFFKMFTDAGSERGSCRRFVPTVMMTNAGRQTVWPEVHINDWCGEYEQRSK